MSFCIPTTVACFAHDQIVKATGNFNKAKPSVVLFDQLCNVFGWDMRAEFTQNSKKGKGQTYSYFLSRAGFRSTRYRVACMMSGIEHDCNCLQLRHTMLVGYEVGVKLAKVEMCRDILSLYAQIERPIIQGDVEGPDGSVEVIAEVAENTLVVESTALDVSGDKVVKQDLILTTSSTEKLHEFPELLNRWFPLGDYLVTSDNNKSASIATFTFPEDLYKNNCISNTLPQEQFMYGDYDVEVMVKVNSHKFQSGRLLVSYIPDPLNVSKKYFKSWVQRLQRPHVWVDVSNATGAKLTVPFEYHRGFVRNIEHGQNCAGVNGAQAMGVEVVLASPIKSGTNQSKSVSVLVWARVTRARLAGMALRIPSVQGPILTPVKAFMELVHNAEQYVDPIMDLTGLDKPRNVQPSTRILPAPTNYFCNGKGVETVTVLQIDPSVSVTMPPRVLSSVRDNTLFDIARKWGYLTNFDWAADAAVGSELARFPIEPTFFSNQVPNTIEFTEVVPPPVSAVCRMSAFWSGTLEMRIIFVSSMHSGSMTISCEFGRESKNNNKCQPYASYTTTFDLGDRKVCDVVIPYIFDNPVRRTNCVPYYTHDKLQLVTAINKYRTGLITRVNSQVFMRVANVLKTPTIAATTVDCIVLIRAGEDFRTFGVIQNNALLPVGEGIDVFPSDKYQATVKARTRRDTEESETNEIKKEKHRGKGLGEVMQELKDEHQTLLEKQFLSADQAAEYAILKQDYENRTKERQEYEERITELERKIDGAQQDCSRIVEVEEMRRERDVAIWSSSVTRQLFRPDNEVKAGVTEKQMKTVAYPTFWAAVNGRYLAQETFEGRWYRVGSKAWEVALTKNFAVTKYKWVAEAQGDDGIDDVTVSNSRDRDPVLCVATRSEMGLWDILRRNLLIRRQVTLGAKERWYIPCVPPQFTWCDETGTVFDDGVRTSAHVAITSQFRAWRGNQRYTVVNFSGQILRIAYLPHSGTRMLNKYKEAGANDHEFNNISIAQVGLPVELNIPVVNPVTTVEVPYYTENVWTLMNNAYLNTNQYWRDKMDDNCGHLVIESDSADAKFDLYWAAGDNFRCGMYIGNVPAQRMRLVDTMTDDNPRVQGVIERPIFRLKDSLGEYLRPSIQGWLDQMNPFSSVREQVVHSAQAVEEASNKVVELLCRGVDKCSLIEDLLRGQGDIIAGQMNKAALAINKVVSFDMSAVALLNLLVDGWVCWKTGSQQVLAVLLSKWMATVGIISLSSVMAVTKGFLSFFSEPEIPSVQGDGVMPTGLIKLLHTVVSCSFLAKSSRSLSRIPEIINRAIVVSGLDKISWCLRTWDAFVRFLNAFYDCLRNMWKWIAYYDDEDARLMIAVTDRNDLFKQFLDLANKYLRIESNSALVTLPSARLEFYALLVLAQKIKKICLVEKCKEVQPILHIISKLETRGNDMAYELGSSPVRFEPFVICLEGPTGIGKSFLSHTLGPKLLQAINLVPRGEAVYVRTPGNNFWDAYQDQPIVMFDDMSNIQDATQNVATISELFALKSSAIFNPPMARLEEKNRRGNPLIVIILTNIPFPDMAESADTHAFDRRRDVMYNVQARTLPDGDVMNPNSEYTHLRFAKHKSSVRGPDGKSIGTHSSMDFPVFLEQITSEFTEYFQKERSNVQRRVDAFFEVAQAEAEKDLFTWDPYSALNRCLFGAQSISTDNSHDVIEDMEVIFSKFLQDKEFDSVIDFFDDKRVAKARAQGGGPSVQGLADPALIDRVIEKDSFEMIPDSRGMPSKFLPTMVTVSRQHPVLEVTEGAIDNCVKWWANIWATNVMLEWEEMLESIRRCCGLGFGRCTCCLAEEMLLLPWCCSAQLCPNCVLDQNKRHLCECGKNEIEVEKRLELCHAAGAILYYLHKVSYHSMTVVVLAFRKAIISVPAMLRGGGAILCLLSAFLLFKHQEITAAATSGLLGMGLCYVGGDTSFYELASTSAKAIYRMGKDMTTLVRILSTQGCASFKAWFRSSESSFTSELVPFVQNSEQSLFFHEQNELRYVIPFKGQRLVKHKIDFSNSCVHWDLFRPKSASSMEVLGVSLGGKDWAPRHLNWEPGYWYYASTDIDVKIPNQHCPFEHCILRRPHVLECLFTKLRVTNAHQWQTFQERLRGEILLETLPVQLLNEIQYSMLTQPQLSCLKRSYEWIKKLAGYDWIGALKEFVKNNIYKILWASSVVLGAAVVLIRYGSKIVDCVRGLCGGSEPASDPESFVIEPQYVEYDNKPRTAARKAHVKVKGLAAKLKDSKQLQGLSESMFPIMAKCIGNVVTISYTSGVKNIEMIGLGVVENCILLPKHYLRNFMNCAKAGLVVWIKRLALSDKQQSAAVIMDDFTEIENHDVMMWRCRVLPPFADIRKHFIKGELLEHRSLAGDGCIFIPPVAKMPASHIINVRISAVEENVAVSGITAAEIHNILYAAKYNYSQKGICGSMVMRNSDQRPITGIHVAGVGEQSKGTGWAAIVTEEFINDMFATLVPEVQSLTAYEDIPHLGEVGDNARSCGDIDDVVFLELGTFERGFKVAQPKSTRIIKSLIADDLNIVPQRVPCPLSAKEPPYLGSGTTPLKEGIKKYGRLTVDLPSDFEKIVEPIMQVEFLAMHPVGIGNRKPLTIEQAVTGCPELPYYDSLNLSSSPGYPWNLTHKAGKHDLIQFSEPLVEGDCVIAENVRKRVEDEIGMLKTGTRPATVFCDYLKDEKKQQSVLTVLGKTRLFCMSPVTFTLRLRMFFLHFFAAFMHNHLKLPHAVGISVNGPDWGIITQNLKKINSEHCWSIDYSNFGPGYPIRAGRLAWKLMSDWLKKKMDYSVDDERIMHGMGEELSTSVHIAIDLCFQQASGSPSGSPDTVIKNSIVNILLFRYCAYKLLYPIWRQENAKQSIDPVSGAFFWEWMRSNVCFYVYGDDIIAATNPKYLPFFNGRVYSEFWRNFGLVTSDSTKRAVVQEFVSYSEFEFLKSGSSPHPTRPGQYLAPLPSYIIEEAAYYIWKGGDEVEDSIVNARASIVLAYGRGPQYFKEWVEKVNTCLANRNQMGLAVTWEELDDMFFQSEAQGGIIPGNRFLPYIPYTCDADEAVLFQAEQASAHYIAELEDLDRQLEALEQARALMEYQEALVQVCDHRKSQIKKKIVLRNVDTIGC